MRFLARRLSGDFKNKNVYNNVYCWWWWFGRWWFGRALQAKIARPTGEDGGHQEGELAEAAQRAAEEAGPEDAGERAQTHPVVVMHLANARARV